MQIFRYNSSRFVKFTYFKLQELWVKGQVVYSLGSNKMVLLHSAQCTRGSRLCSCYTRTDARLLCTRLEIGQWPPISPDLSPVDYGIWEQLQERVYC